LFACGGFSAGFDVATLGTRMFVPQFRQRTVFPRAAEGTARIRRHVRLGHMILTFSLLMLVFVHRESATRS
jgi:hypothetical protein